MNETAGALLAQIEGNRLLLAGIISIGLGILILVMPRLLNYIVAAYLIVIGVLWVLSAT